MNYRNYEGKIVERYGVELKGWPNSKPGICNPATLGRRPQLERLLAALESGDCHWVVLNDDELEERKKENQAREDRGEQVYLPRKSANRRSNPKGVKSSEFLDDDDTEEEAAKKRLRSDDEDGGEDQRDKKRPRSDEDGDIDSDNDGDTENSDDGDGGDSNNDGDTDNGDDGDSGNSDGLGDGDDD